MENQLAELKNEIEFLRDEVAFNRLVFASLYRKLSKEARKQFEKELSNDVAHAALVSEQAKFQIHLQRFLNLVQD
ncbi:hypothetical protein MUU45_001705 [Rodentibacter pneumotropicus]|uniref:Uncharacterized protein n=1 Tax=Rodentibacter pneumotropicus TaxID=758 RepID=A0AAW5LB38_9PAST|nr:hypothetical protein [Rodentibacter pneumotropicus]MCQ9121218.1 hypothetical protein [Rodentibacter pneumotropicus]